MSTYNQCLKEKTEKVVNNKGEVVIYFPFLFTPYKKFKPHV